MPSERIDLVKLGSVFEPYGATHTPTQVERASEAAVQTRCSLQVLRRRTTDLAADAELSEVLKNRWSHWIDAAAESDQLELADDTEVRKNNKKKRRTPEADIVESQEALQHCSNFEAKLPKAFRLHDQTAQMTAYVDRESRLDSNVVVQATPSHLLLTKSKAISTPPPANVLQTLILRITVFSRPAAGRGKHGAAMLSDTNEDLNATPIRTQELEIRAHQTLADLRHALICRFDDLPARIGGTHGAATLQEGVSFTGRKRSTDSVFGIEGLLYGENSASPECYARLIGSIPSRARQALGADQSTPTGMIDSGKRMQDVRLADLRLSAGQHYWFLHQGSCEHAWEITSIRAPHVMDVPVTSGGACDPSQATYPRTTYLTTESLMRPIVRYERVFAPPESYTLTKCSICARRPSKLLVVGGARVGESSAAPEDNEDDESSMDTQTAVAGLPEQHVPMCEACWALVAPKPTKSGPGPLPTAPEVPTAPILVEGASADASKERWAQAGGPSWCVVPLLD